ncbi:Membrane protein involved in the export of O-antigen and teichoic acid [Neorhodopirellula lusitana]|uniref:Membrane protein involved in the export of O-antigen and teichoic acid n=2 Tax=Neorhodopirellula lusitana TaxID=445327 RepID=A0ABY1Q197_9BACT|nr:Membrane protein involved in the export of O-antigen and teichoic acid [Neorhodopirellula lusitana]
MLAMTVLGRGIGFIRGMAFCRLMDDTDVGRWSMAFGFITLITPVMLLGIPGVLPKFTEYFRLRGQLPSFVRRIAIGTLACTGVFVAAMFFTPSWFGYFIFLKAESASLIYSVATAMVGMIIYNFVSDLNASLRQVRLVSLMQFIHGVGFTVLSLVWLVSGGDFQGLVWMFTAASLIATLPGFASLITNWVAVTTSHKIENQSAELTRSADTQNTNSNNESPCEKDSHDSDVADETGPLDLAGMIRRLAPYALALWMVNLIGNMFELSDRYMILHFLPVPSDLTNGLSLASIASLRETMGQAAVGQYHSGRIIPMVLLSVATMIAGVLVPYLSADWEAKKFAAVRTRVGDTLLAVSLIFTLGSAFAILIGPYVFGTLLQGRYTDGLRLMPMALCFYTWAALVSIGQCYLLTAEKGRSIAIAMFGGLVANIVLNGILLPQFGLTGAVIATLCSHCIVMLGIWSAMVIYGCPITKTWIGLSILPASLLVSPWMAMIAVCVGVVLIWRDDAQRERIVEALPAKVRAFI